MGSNHRIGRGSPGMKSNVLFTVAIIVDILYYSLPTTMATPTQLGR